VATARDQAYAVTLAVNEQTEAVVFYLVGCKRASRWKARCKGLRHAPELGWRDANASRRLRLRSTCDDRTEQNYVFSTARPSIRIPPPPQQPATLFGLDYFFQLC